MEYYSGKHHFKRIGEIISNQTNDVCICEEIGSSSEKKRLLWIVKNRILARTLLEVFHEKDETPLYLDTFSLRENTVFVFPYEGERSLFRFLGGELLTEKEQEEVWRRLVEACMTCDVPYAILFQILRQRGLQIQPDGEITFSYCLDLRNFEAERSEEDCATVCAEIILELMEMSKVKDTPLKRLLQEKCEEDRYGSFAELFQDIISNSKSFKRNRKENGLKRALRSVISNKDKIVKILIVLCVLLAAVAVILTVSQLKYGEIPILRLFQNTFQTIGTEKLVQ